MGEDPSPAELWRTLQDFRTETREHVDALRREQGLYVRADTFEEVRRSTGERVGGVEKSLAVLSERYSKLGYFILASAVLPLMFFIANYLISR